MRTDPNNGPNVKVMAEIAAPIEKKAMIAANYLPYIGRWSGGWPLRGSEQRHEVERCD